MPMRIKRPCRHPGCPALVESGYCDKHKLNIDQQRKQRYQEYTKHRKDPEAMAFYHSKDWRITSEQYRAAHPVCNRCPKPVKLVHHDPELAVLIERGLDPLDWQWLEGLCWGCHEKTKRKGDRG